MLDEIPMLLPHGAKTNRHRWEMRTAHDVEAFVRRCEAFAARKAGRDASDDEGSDGALSDGCEYECQCECKHG